MKAAVIEEIENFHSGGYRLTAREIAATLRENGPLWSLQKEWCSQAFQQAHAVRAMLAAYRIDPEDAFMQSARSWAEMTLAMQGTHGHPDRYNMGYGYRLRNGVPYKWYVADCGTIAVTLLDVSSLLEMEDPLRDRILESVSRFADYIISDWSLPDGSFSLGYDEFNCLNRTPYHCANAQSNLFFWPLAEMTKNDKYRQQAMKTTRFLAEWEDYDCGYYGSGVSNRAYNAESMVVSLHYLDDDEEKLKEKIARNFFDNMVAWGIDNYGRKWFRRGEDISAKDPLLLMSLYLFQACGRDDDRISAVIDDAYDMLDNRIRAACDTIRRADISGTAIASCNTPDEMREKVFLPKYYATEGIIGMALAVRRDRGSLFPLSDGKRQLR